MPASVLMLRTAGTNCDEETRFAFEQAGGTVETVHIRALSENPSTLEKYRILVLAGGFSYGDDLGSGVIFANEIRQKLYDSMQKFVDKGGLVLGICNGFQILVKSGLLSGAKGKTEATNWPSTLTFNDSQRFEDRWVTLKVEESPSPFLSGHAGKLVTFPVAHGEGKFVTRDPEVLQALKQAKQIAFRYVSAEGQAPVYPENPNGSTEHIAGITDTTGRVLGLMPHPERHALPWQHPRWTREGLKSEGDGMFIFKNAVKYAQ